jgi:hypothetical protein
MAIDHFHIFTIRPYFPQDEAAAILFSFLVIDLDLAAHAIPSFHVTFVVLKVTLDTYIVTLNTQLSTN